MDYKRNMVISSSPNVYYVEYYQDIIETTVAKTTDDVDQWISKVFLADLHKPEDLFVGLDCEYAFILQLCVNRRCLIFQFLPEVEIPKSLINFLKDSKFTFIGILIERDACILSRYYGLSLSRNRMDLPSIATKLFRRGGVNYLSMTELARVCLKKKVKKPNGFIGSDWKVKNLSIPQVRCACIDAFVTLELGIFFNKMSLIGRDLSYLCDDDVNYWNHGDEVESPSDGNKMYGQETPSKYNIVQKMDYKSIMEISSAPNVHYVQFYEDFIETTVAKTTDDVDKWISEVCKVLIVDQYKPEDVFVGLDSKYGDTLQLCVNRRCLFFQFRPEVEIPESLINFLKDPKFTLVGIAIEHDADLLFSSYGLSLSGNRMDLPSVASGLFVRVEIVRDSLEELARVCLNKEAKKPKGFIDIDWTVKDLSISHIEYACIDAFLALELGIFLKKMSLLGRDISYLCYDDAEYWSDEGEVVKLSYGNEEESRALATELMGQKIKPFATYGCGIAE